jgi:hypothetical protein
MKELSFFYFSSGSTVHEQQSIRIASRMGPTIETIT